MDLKNPDTELLQYVLALDVFSFLLAVDFQDAFGSSAAVELIDILSYDCNLASLFPQSLLTLSNGQVGCIRIFCEHDLAAVVVKLPNTGGIPGKGLWSSKVLQDGNGRNCH